MAISLWDFEGDWQLERRIDDHLTGGQGRFCGQAVFARDGDGLTYRETGWLVINGARFQAERQYLWHPDGARIAVMFGDGRPFHHFAPEPLSQAGHWCDPDQYDVRYDLGDWPQWQAKWRVTGPRKDYTMLSQYAR
ncbi:MAG: DUF6314 family protein [Paracoccaceae bacterium]